MLRNLKWKTAITVTTNNSNHKKLNRQNLSHACTHMHVCTHAQTHIPAYMSTEIIQEQVWGGWGEKIC